MGIDISNLKPLVEKMARENFVNITVGEDDVVQELWCKIIQLLPSLSELSEDHAFRYIKVCLGNLIKDIKYSEMRTPGSSQYSLQEVDLSEAVGGEISSIFEKISDHNQEDFLSAKELHNIVMVWSANQSNLIKTFVKERMDSSKEIEAIWEEKLKTSPRCKNAKSIPIWSLLNILGINEKEYYKKIRTDLALHLEQHGYTV